MPRPPVRAETSPIYRSLGCGWYEARTRLGREPGEDVREASQQHVMPRIGVDGGFTVWQSTRPVPRVWDPRVGVAPPVPNVRWSRDRLRPETPGSRQYVIIPGIAEAAVAV